jgi:quinol monooxygenase YgiN
MVVVVGRVRTDEGRRAELIRIGQAVASTSREEPGCISYQVCQDTEDEDAFVFVEEWESEEALEAHFGTSHIATFMSAIRETIVGQPEVKFHTVARSRDLAEVSAG